MIPTRAQRTTQRITEAMVTGMEPGMEMGDQEPHYAVIIKLLYATEWQAVGFCQKLP